MANASIGGLVSGLDTATIISQLMQVEAQPQTLLKSRLSTQQSAVTALQSLNSKFAGLVTKVNDLMKTGAFSPVKTMSSSTDVTVAVDPGATAATLSFTVDSVAASTRKAYSTTGALGADVMTPDLDFRIDYDDGRPSTWINTGDGKMQSIANALNSSNTGLRATLINTGAVDANGKPVYELHVASIATGTASGFSLTNADPANPTVSLSNPVAFMGTEAVTGGTDAKITIAGQATPLVSQANTFTDVMPGVDVTLGTKATGDVTITVEQDTKAASDSVKSLVAAANEILAEIDKLTAYDAVTKKSGSLAGDSTLRALRSEVLETVSGVISTDSVAFAGVQLDRYGKLTFDEAKFASAYASSPGGVATKMSAFATRLETVAGAASNTTNGTLTAAIKGRQTSVSSMQKAIESWDDRLELRRAALTRQFTALEVALGKLQGQSSWLAGQISSLPSMNQ